MRTILIAAFMSIAMTSFAATVEEIESLASPVSLGCMANGGGDKVVFTVEKVIFKNGTATIVYNNEGIGSFQLIQVDRSGYASRGGDVIASLLEHLISEQTKSIMELPGVKTVAHMYFTNGNTEDKFGNPKPIRLPVATIAITKSTISKINWESYMDKANLCRAWQGTFIKFCRPFLSTFYVNTKIVYVTPTMISLQ